MPRLALLGHVARARGLRGEVLVRGDSDALALIVAAEHILLVRDGVSRRVKLTVVREAKGALTLSFDGVTDRDGAEALVGASVGLELDALPPPTIERWTWVEVEGFEVVTTGGVRLGVATDRISTGAHDVFVVTGGEREEVLVPASPNVLKEIDASTRRIVVEAIPGLLELNE